MYLTSNVSNNELIIPVVSPCFVRIYDSVRGVEEREGLGQEGRQQGEPSPALPSYKFYCPLDS